MTHESRLEHEAPSAFSEPYRRQWQTLQHIRQGEGRAKRLFGVERLFLMGICLALLGLPAMAVRGLGQTFGEKGRRIAVELYAFGKPLLLVAFLFAGWSSHPLQAVLAVVALVDLYASLSAMVFLQHFHTGRTSHGRSLILLAVNFTESVIAFAILYGFSLSVGPQGAVAPEPITDPFKLLYFSCVTAASVGYGDYLPITKHGQMIAMVQILSSMGFIFILLTSFVANFNEREPV